MVLVITDFSEDFYYHFCGSGNSDLKSAWRALGAPRMQRRGCGVPLRISWPAIGRPQALVLTRGLSGPKTDMPPRLSGCLPQPTVLALVERLGGARCWSTGTSGSTPVSVGTDCPHDPIVHERARHLLEVHHPCPDRCGLGPALRGRLLFSAATRPRNRSDRLSRVPHPSAYIPRRSALDIAVEDPP